MLSGISIEPFRGDLEGLERMAHSSWRDEYGIESFPNFYRTEFLKFLFDRIEDKTHLLAAYRGNEIVSFLANLPQRFHLDGHTHRAVYSCLMVTRKELLRQGLGKAIIDEALKLNQKFHYDFSLLTLEKGHRSTQMIKKLEETGKPVEWVKRNYVIARILDRDRVVDSEGLKK
ncbi:MAG: GNAT family N-acetyltransferase, partial [Candidatus Aminicenantes bacterium]|nr:GNAT family N-acetyltransferase [Candidatus Aminicenantes bacterium]